MGRQKALWITLFLTLMLLLPPMSWAPRSLSTPVSSTSKYDQNVAGATAAGLKVACYHFVYPLPPLASQPTRDPKVQAQMHVAAAGNSVTVVC
ncbi:unnamed protein product, partial [Sphagnum balticum]